MDSKLLGTILEKIKETKIAVVGDFCLDAYWFLDKSKNEISVESGKMTQSVKSQRYSPGGAGNVVANLAAMEVGDIRAFGVIGPDPFGIEMVNILHGMGINADNLLVQDKNWSTHVYTKPYINNVEQNRIDFGNYNELAIEVADRLIDKLAGAIPDMDIIIINQQVLSGIHTDYFKKKLVEIIRHFPEKKFIVDSRNYNDIYDGAWRKMNDTEAAVLCGMKENKDETLSYSDIKKAAVKLFERFKKPLFITRGDKGSVVVNEEGVRIIYGLMLLSRTDPVGAGDSYLAGAAAVLGAGFNMQSAAEMGTFVAGVTVQKLFQTGTASPHEIFELGRNPDFIYRPELAEDIQQAKYLDDSGIEIVNIWNREPKVRYAIFDHDGTISTLRQGWEGIMTPIMINAILGGNNVDADETLHRKVQKRVEDFIEKTTGVQTLVQMKGLVGMVREFGFVPQNEILDEFGYKKIYNDELLKTVKKREEKIRNGELESKDFVLKNAILFLEKLHQAGIKLYLASGTDDEDVKHEARVLGYDKFFEGGIFGAVNDINREAKKEVLDRILNEIGAESVERIVTFGDGPVEIRETVKRGGMTVGVASDEVKRYGLNEYKRSRLIKAGADVIIPDFSQMQALLELLKIK